MQPRISVLMGIYNCAGTLPEALDSLLHQTYQDFKIILCDDGSTDDTLSVAWQYAEMHRNIVLLKNEKNLKLAATLNRCLEYADTEYVARMDGDDISLPTRFEQQIQFLDQHPEFAVVSCPMIYFDENGDWGIGKALSKPTTGDFKYGAPHAHAPCMIRTAVIKEIGGYTDVLSTVRVEDYDLWYKIYKAGYKGYNLQQILYKMRDDQYALNRRTFQSRINASKLTFRVLKSFNVPHAWFFSLRIILKGLVPPIILKYIRRRRYVAKLS